MTLPADRGHLLTEQSAGSPALHSYSAAELVQYIQAEDAKIATAMQAAQTDITAFIEAVEPGFKQGGRLIYIGAGTSGRLGVLDASEAPPTFQLTPDRIIGIIAGGDGALRKSSEGKEDEPDGAVAELSALQLGPHDAVLGIAAGGTTPYVRGGLSWAAHLAQPPVTCLMSCVEVALPEGVSHGISLLVGPEVLTGSTRMKAGTATKLALNTISTTLMIRCGRVYENQMVALRATNDKLRDRAARIIARIVPCDRAEAFTVLDAADGDVRIAVVMKRLSCDAPQARAHLADASGILSAVIDQ